MSSEPPAGPRPLDKSLISGRVIAFLGIVLGRVWQVEDDARLPAPSST